jgi:hypothetical protein
VRPGCSQPPTGPHHGCTFTLRVTVIITIIITIITTPSCPQVLTTKLDWVVSDPEAKLLVAKFVHEDKPEFVNYTAFANTVDPPERCGVGWGWLGGGWGWR